MAILVVAYIALDGLKVDCKTVSNSEWEKVALGGTVIKSKLMAILISFGYKRGPGI